MPISARHRLMLAITTLLVLLVAAPAARAACDDQVLEQPFAAYGDYAQYTLVSDRSVELRAGQSFTTPPVCVSLAHPTVRFFLRNGGGLLGALSVEVVTHGGLRLPVGLVAGLLGSGDREPSPPFLILANLLDDEVSFRFTAGGLGGGWTIEDVWVDPYKKG